MRTGVSFNKIPGTGFCKYMHKFLFYLQSGEITGAGENDATIACGRPDRKKENQT